MSNSSIKDAGDQQHDNSRNNVRKDDRHTQLQRTKKRSVPRNRPRSASNTFPTLTELPLHIQLLLVIILLMFVTNHVAVRILSFY